MGRWREGASSIWWNCVKVVGTHSSRGCYINELGTTTATARTATEWWRRPLWVMWSVWFFILMCNLYLVLIRSLIVQSYNFKYQHEKYLKPIADEGSSSLCYTWDRQMTLNECVVGYKMNESAILISFILETQWQEVRLSWGCSCGWM